MPRRPKKGKTMQVDNTPVHACEVCGRETCHHCQECGTPSSDHATTCSRYVSKRVVFHPASGLTFSLTMRDGVLLTLQQMTDVFPITWENISLGDDRWQYWQSRINLGHFDINVN